MLKSLRVRNFRSFDDFVVNDLARVNLFVGSNNCGKTSLLEAAELLLTPDPAGAMTDIPWRRKEDRSETGSDISHLFRGHRGSVGSRIEIDDPGDPKQQVVCELAAEDLESLNRRRARRAMDPLVRLPKATLGVRLTFADGSEPVWLPLVVRDHLLIVAEKVVSERDVSPVRIVGTEGEPSTEIWEEIVLTTYETWATDALRVIEPDIDRIAVGPQEFFVRMARSDQRIPLGSMGDGIRRMLNLAINLATAAGGSLIVDEIDTGLHYSVMTRMWRLVVEMARRLDIQVLATTHSEDCIRALAHLYEETPGLGSEFALHRVVRGAGSAVRYSAEEIQAASASGIEMRGTN